MKSLAQLQKDLDIDKSVLAALLLDNNSKLYVYCQSEKFATSFEDEQNYGLVATGLMQIDERSLAKYLQVIKYNKNSCAR